MVSDSYHEKFKKPDPGVKNFNFDRVGISFRLYEFNWLSYVSWCCSSRIFVREMHTDAPSNKKVYKYR